MKKVAVIILVNIFTFAGIIYAEEKSDNKTISQEEKTDKAVNDFFKNMEKAIIDSTKKVADELK